jgi:hypothetical protein
LATLTQPLSDKTIVTGSDVKSSVSLKAAASPRSTRGLLRLSPYNSASSFNSFYKIYALYIKHKSFIPKKKHSIFGEDIFADKYFKKLDKGFYVDVGSYHPFFWSNTYLLFKRKWEGINIDINRLSVDLFNMARSNDHNVNASVSNSSKRVKKYRWSHYYKDND